MKEKTSSNRTCGRDSENIFGAFLKSFSIVAYVLRWVKLGLRCAFVLLAITWVDPVEGYRGSGLPWEVTSCYRYLVLSKDLPRSILTLGTREMHAALVEIR